MASLRLESLTREAGNKWKHRVQTEFSNGRLVGSEPDSAEFKEKVE